MAAGIPVFFVFVLNCLGINLFVEPEIAPKDVILPYFSSLLFGFSIALVLLDVSLYPKTFRRLHWILMLLYEFLTSAYVMENMLNYFWFPLEYEMMMLIPAIVFRLTGSLKYFGLDCSCCGLCDMNTTSVCNIIQMFTSYLLSIMFFLCVLQITGFANFKLLDCGLPYFIKDVTRNTFRRIKTFFPRRRGRRSRQCSHERRY